MKGLTLGALRTWTTVVAVLVGWESATRAVNDTWTGGDVTQPRRL